LETLRTLQRIREIRHSRHSLQKPEPLNGPAVKDHIQHLPKGILQAMENISYYHINIKVVQLHGQEMQEDS
jgi:hypothetical protein